MFKGKKWFSLLRIFVFLFIFVSGCSSADSTNLIVKQQEEQQKQQEEQQRQQEVQQDAGLSANHTIERNTESTPQVTKAKESTIDAEQTAEVKKVEVEKDGQNVAENATTEAAATLVSPAPLSPTVSLAIRGPQGEDYIILEETETEWQEGDTVLDVLKRVTREKKIHLEYRGRKTTAYVEGIDNLYEFDRGPLSGWLYRVNGEYPDSSAGAWKVEVRDQLEWLYTLDLGQDVGGRRQGIQGQ